MFVFLVLVLLLAAMTDNTNEVIINDTVVDSHLATDNQLMNEAVSDNVLRN